MKTLEKLVATTLKLVVFAGLVAGGYYAYQQYTAEVEDDGLGALPTVVADVRDITVSVSATGVLQPIKIVEIKSKASGEILEMPVEVGDHLRAGDLIAGAVMKIEPQAVVEQSVTTFPVLSRIDNSDGLLLPGMNADVSIVIHERGGMLAVPNEAASAADERVPADTWGADGVRREPGVVFVLAADGRIVPRQVVTGVRDWDAVEVLDGIEPGAELVLLPSTSLLRSQQSMRERFSRRNAVVPTAGR